MKIAILTMFVLLSACNENCASKSATSTSTKQNLGQDDTSGTIAPPPPPPSTIADWQSKTADEISNFKDANGKNLFQLNINNPKALQDIITKVGPEKAKKMVIEGSKNHINVNGIYIINSPLKMAVEDDNEESLKVLLAIPEIEKDFLHDQSLLHVAIQKGSAKAFKALVNKEPDLLKNLYLVMSNFSLMLNNEDMIESLEEMIKVLTADQINAKDQQGRTILHLEAIIEPRMIALLAKNPHLDINILYRNNDSALDIAIEYQKKLVEQLLIPNKYNENHISYLNMQKQREANKDNRDKAVAALLATNKLSKENINNAAFRAAFYNDVDVLKALITAGADISIKMDINDKIKANKLVYESIMNVFNKEYCEIANKINNSIEELFISTITKNIIATLQALKDAGLPKEEFSKGILKHDNGDDIHWKDVGHYSPFSLKFIWSFKKVQDKLIELSK